MVKAFIDGSYNKNTKEFSFGLVYFSNGETREFSKKVDKPEHASMRNVAGEVWGALAAIALALKEGEESITIFYDYEGIAKWANGEWKANKDLTKYYKSFVAEARESIEIEFVKVKAHSGVLYNERADLLAKEALGI